MARNAPRSGKPDPTYRELSRYTAPRSQQRYGQSGSVPAARTRNGLWRGSAARVFRGNPLLSPPDAVPADLPLRVAGPEHGGSGGGDEPESGRHHPAGSGREGLTGTGCPAVPLPAGSAGGAIVDQQRQRAAGGFQLFPGANRAGS